MTTPLVSVIIPARNEARYIVRCIEAVLGQDYPRDCMEVFVVDGCSSDGTPDLVHALCSNQPMLNLLVNQARTIPHALNLGIRAARGSIIVRVDAHTIISSDYLTQCVRVLQATGADNVGGPPRNCGDTFWGDVIGRAMASRFGRPAQFHRLAEPQEVDSVYLGAFRRDTLARVGLFDESILINEDYELNYRIRQAGGRVYSSPDIQSDYYNRRSLGALRKQFWNYGRGKGLVLRLHPGSVLPRHLVAPLFVVALVAGSVLAAFRRPAPLATLLSLYGFACMTFSRSAAQGRGRRVSVATAVAFTTMHLSWGAGVLTGLSQPTRRPDVAALSPVIARKLRVLLMIDRLGWGGAERVLVTLAAGLHARGIDVRVMQMGSRGSHPWVDELEAIGVPVLDLGLRSLFDVPKVFSLALYLRRERIDIVHTHLRYSDLVGRTAAALARRPVISTIHSITEVQAGWREAVRRYLDYLSARVLCPVVITVSEAQRRAYQRAAGMDARRIETHLNGINTDQFRPDRKARVRVRAEFGIGADAPLFITVAVLRPGKGVQYLLEAAALVSRTIPDARFVIVGDGQERVSLEARAAKLGLAGVVTFLGTRGDVPELLAAADVCVHPSLFEALPTTILEAMAVGLPVVATRVGGVPEILTHGKTGLLVSPARADELAAGIVELSDPAARACMGAAARAWVEVHASTPVWVDRLEHVYRRVAWHAT